MRERDRLLIDLWHQAMFPNPQPRPGSPLYERLRAAVLEIVNEYANQSVREQS